MELGEKRLSSALKSTPNKETPGKDGLSEEF